MVVFVKDYLPALAALPIGAIAGLVLTTLAKRGALGGGKLGDWDRWATVPLLLAAAAAHLALLPVVEPLRMVLFALYAISVLATVGLAVVGIGIWRMGAIVLPLGSIAGYFFFAFVVHQADVVGLLIKLVEVVAMVAALVPLLRDRPARERWTLS
jgi:hypothetical protein